MSTPQELLSIDYTALQHRNELQELIRNLRESTDETIASIHELSNKQRQKGNEYKLITNKMQEHMLENTRRILDFNSLISEEKENYAREMLELEEEKQRMRKQLEHAYIHSDKRIEELQNEYKGLIHLEMKEAAYLKEIQEKESGLINRQYMHHDHMNQEMNQQKQLNQQMEKKQATTLVESKKYAFVVAKDIVVSEKNINEEKNISLKNKLIQLESTLSKLKKQRNTIKNKQKQSLINVELDEQQLQQYKAVGSIQKVKIKNLQEKIQNLSQQMKREIEKRKKKINNKQKQIELNQNQQKIKHLKLEKEKEIMKTNIEKIKILGETILLQRNQIQRFFIIALQHCKKQIEESTVTQSKNYGTEVDIEQLTPKDKLRILTNLYTKLALG